LGSLGKPCEAWGSLGKEGGFNHALNAGGVLGKEGGFNHPGLKVHMGPIT